MILKGSQRGGPRQLASHLLNTKDNDHVTVGETRGFASETLYGAMAEVQAVSKGTRCRQPVFSLSLSPPKDATVTTSDLMDAVDRAEAALGLQGQPRAVVIHEKNGRKHAHAVWSRIDGATMTARNMAFFKRKLNALSKELYLENGWELPDGFKGLASKNPMNFTLAEWQQSKRTGVDPREVKQVFQSAWQRSDNVSSFKAALEESGYYLAKGDRRGFVAVNFQGDVYSVSRMTGAKTKDVSAKLGAPDRLKTVDQVKARNRDRLKELGDSSLDTAKAAAQAELDPLLTDTQKVTARHRIERIKLNRGQEIRRKKESIARAARFRRGLGIVMDLLTGRLFTLRKENEQDAYKGHLRDVSQREQLFSEQLKERKTVQKRIEVLRERQSVERRALEAEIAEKLTIFEELSNPGRTARTLSGPDFSL